MLNRKIFRANDIRGVYPSEINEETVFDIGRGLSRRYRKKIVVGRDTRLSSPSLYRALQRGLRTNARLKIIDAGLMTTPTLYFLVNHFRLEGGIMVTASHTPKEFNGLKIVGSGATMVSGEELYELISNIQYPISNKGLKSK